MTDLPRTQALRCFSTVAQEGTVSRAASLLNLTQTEAGAALLPLAHKAVSAAQDFIAAANSLKQAQRGRLRVGTILDPEFTRLGPFVRSLTASSHETEIILRHGMNDDLLTQIGKGELDVGYYIEATPNRSSSSQPPCERPLTGVCSTTCSSRSAACRSGSASPIRKRPRSISSNPASASASPATSYSTASRANAISSSPTRSR